jgi:hypothetical protein
MKRTIEKLCIGLLLLCLISIIGCLPEQKRNSFDGTFFMSQEGENFERRRHQVRFNRELVPYIEFSGNKFTLVDYPVREADDVVTTRDRDRFTFLSAQDRTTPLLQLDSWQQMMFFPESARFRRVFSGTFVISDNAIELVLENGNIKAFPFMRTENTVTIGGTQFSRKTHELLENKEAAKFVGKWEFVEGTESVEWNREIEKFPDGTRSINAPFGIFWEVSDNKVKYFGLGLAYEYDFTFGRDTFTILGSRGTATFRKAK